MRHGAAPLLPQSRPARPLCSLFIVLFASTLISWIACHEVLPSLFLPLSLSRHARHEEVGIALRASTARAHLRHRQLAASPDYSRFRRLPNDEPNDSLDAPAWPSSPPALVLAAAAAAAIRSATATRAAVKALSAEDTGAAQESLLQKLKVPIYIALWYIFSIKYNIANKKTLLAFPYPWTVAFSQLAFGWFIFVPLWLLKVRKAPKLTAKEALALSPAALGHLATHIGALIAFTAGAVSFGHIVKASEPVVSSLLNFIFMGEVLAWQVYASLVPIIAGVALASVSELSFTWLCFNSAMASNLGSAARAVYGKKVMSRGTIGENMDAANIYAMLTVLATVMMVPLTLALEGPMAIVNGFQAAYASGGTHFLSDLFYSGLYFYMYNEVAFQALGELDPVSHAVANTMKRVGIIAAAIVVFRTAVTPLGVIGSSIAIMGAMLYSLAKSKFK